MRPVKTLACAVLTIAWVFTLLGAAKLPEAENSAAEWIYWADLPLTYEEQEALHNAADEMGIPYELAASVIWRETNFRNIYGDTHKALMAYNMGETGARRNWDAGVMSTEYSRTIINFMNETFFNGEIGGSNV